MGEFMSVEKVSQDVARGIVQAYRNRLLVPIDAGSVDAEMRARAIDDTYLDDLRPPDEPSLKYYPRMTTVAQAQALFKFKISRLLGWDITPVGQACWRLIGVQVRTGIAATMPLIIGPDGKPNAKIVVFEYWPGAPLLDPTAKPRYYERAVGGWTDANGVLAFCYGEQGKVGADGGPFTVWPSAAPPQLQPQFADALVNIGWLGGTDHFTPSGVWRYEVKGQTPPVPPIEPEPQPSGCLAAFFKALAEASKTS